MQRVSVDDFAIKSHSTKEVAKVVEKLVNGRLLLSDKGEIEIVHEALLCRWGILRTWVKNSREHKELKQGIEDGAALWERKMGDLLTRNTLAAALAWVEEDANASVPLGLSTKAREFLEASKKRQEEEADKLHQQRVVARQQLAISEARRLVSASLMERTSERVDLSLLLLMASIQEVEATQTPALKESEDALLSTLQSHPRLDSYLHGHTGFISALEFSPKGSLLASASRDKTVILWDLRAQQALTILHGHEAEVSHLAFSPNGSLLASAGRDKTIVLWDLKQQHVLETLSVHHHWLNHLLFSPDGSLLVAAGAGPAILWDLKKQQVSATLLGHDAGVRHLSFSPDGNILASASYDRTIILWDLKRRHAFKTLFLLDASVRHLSFSPDGSLLAAVSDNKAVTLWDLKRWQTFESLRGYGREVHHLSFSPEGSLLAAISDDKTIILWDLKQQQSLATLRGHEAKLSHWDTSRDSWRARARTIANRNMTLEEWRTHMGERPYRKIFEDLPGPAELPLP